MRQLLLLCLICSLAAAERGPSVVAAQERIAAAIEAMAKPGPGPEALAKSIAAGVALLAKGGPLERPEASEALRQAFAETAALVGPPLRFQRMGHRQLGPSALVVYGSLPCARGTVFVRLVASGTAESDTIVTVWMMSTDPLGILHESMLEPGD